MTIILSSRISLGWPITVIAFTFTSIYTERMSREWTFETKVVPLTVAEARVLTRVGEHNKMVKQFEDYARRNKISQGMDNGQQ